MLLNIPLSPPIHLLGIPMEFFLFGLTLLGIALFHHRTMTVAITGLVSLIVYKLFFTDFNLITGFQHESMTLINLFALLMGFGLLARHFQQSRLPTILPHYLPDNWTGG